MSLSPDVFSGIKTFIENLTGIQLPESNYQQTSTYITERMNQLVIDSAAYKKLASSDIDEYNRLMQVVTINETYFFREEKIFHLLADWYIPEISTGNRIDSVNIWSSTCSSGEEALSLYAVFSRHLDASLQFQTYASDISSEMLEKFNRGSYRRSKLRDDGKHFHHYLDPMISAMDKTVFTIQPKVLENIDRRQLNLFSDNLDSLPQMDIIFLRNTLIYMSQENKSRILDRLSGKLKPGGLLVLSFSELPLINHPALEIRNIGNTYFLEKIAPEYLNAQLLNKRIANLASSGGKKNIQDLLAEHRQRRNNVSAPQDLPEKKSAAPRPLLSAEILLKPDLLQVCRAIQQRLNNPISEAFPDKIETVVLVVVEIIDSCQLHDGSNTLGLIEKHSNILPPALAQYFKGFSLYQHGRRSEATSLFKASFECSPGFWPARYRYVQELSDNDSSKEAALRKTIALIRLYIERGSYEFQFLLEGFNARYYQMICENNLQKLLSREPSHGY